MRMTDAFNSGAIASVYNEVASNKIPYIGEALFPTRKKASLDLKWIKTSKGLPVSLSPAAFDTKSTIRSRQGITIQETEMAYFKESMLLKEQDEQDIMRIEDSTDPFAREVLDRVYDDATTLVDGAMVVPERMRFQLLAAPNGHPSISISANGATYEYNYDKDGSYEQNNFTELLSTAKWDDVDNSDPLADVEKAIDSVEELTGEKPELMIVSKKTMGYLKKNKSLKNYVLAQNPTATVMMTEGKVKELFSTELGVAIIVYSKKFKDENGVAHQFYPDGMATLVPSGELGNTWYGMTPEERTLVMKSDADVTMVEEGIAVAVTITDDPVHTKTTVSEIVLPSFERMDSTYQIKCY